MAKLFSFTVLVFFFVSSVMTAQESQKTVKVSTLSYKDLVKDLGDAKSSDNRIDSKLAKKLIKTMNFPKELVEKMEKIPADKLIILSKSDVDEFPLINGGRVISFKDLLSKALGTLSEPGCLVPPFFNISCSCDGQTLTVTGIPSTYCNAQCYTNLGIYIACSPPCWTVFVPCD